MSFLVVIMFIIENDVTSSSTDRRVFPPVTLGTHFCLLLTQPYL